MFKSLRKKYGTLYSLKLGAYKFVVAEDADSVKEVLVKKSADYAGRPPFYSFVSTTLGMYIDLSIFILKPNTDTWLSQI